MKEPSGKPTRVVRIYIVEVYSDSKLQNSEVLARTEHRKLDVAMEQLENYKDSYSPGCTVELWWYERTETMHTASLLGAMINRKK